MLHWGLICISLNLSTNGIKLEFLKVDPGPLTATLCLWLIMMGEMSPIDLDFEKATFWVRMFHLPLACMGRDIGFKIGASVGVVEDVDVGDDGVGWGEFFRVQILLDLSKLLPRGCTILVQDKAIWVAFQYEKIPKFCFKCGVIRHGSRGCGLTGGRKLYGGGIEQQYGPWLRVPFPNRRMGGPRWGYLGDRRGHADFNNLDGLELADKMRPTFETDKGEQRDIHGGGSSGNSASPMRRGREIQSRDPSESFQFSGIGDRELQRDREEILIGGEIQGSQTGNNSLKNSFPIEDGTTKEHNNENAIIEGENLAVQSRKGKNVYVGQWDSIKERMVWEIADRELQGLMCNSLCMEALKLPPVQGPTEITSFQFKISVVTEKAHMLSKPGSSAKIGRKGAPRGWGVICDQGDEHSGKRKSRVLHEEVQSLRVNVLDGGEGEHR